MLTQRLVGGWTLCAAGPDETGTETWNERRPPEAQAAPVPGIIQQVLPEHHGIAWYWCEFTAPARTGPGRLLLSFEAVDYAATVWVNGHPVGGHEGGDTPFTLDITAAVQDGPGNLLAVRVLNPAAERIDGIVLNETPHGNKTAPDTGFWPGRSYNFGGIIGEVGLRVVPGPGIGEVFVTATLETGEIAAHIHIEGHADGITTRTLAVTVAEDQSGFVAARAAQTVPCGPGTTETTVRLTVGDVHPWDVDDPFLYRVTVTMSDGGPPLDETHGPDRVPPVRRARRVLPPQRPPDLPAQHAHRQPLSARPAGPAPARLRPAGPHLRQGGRLQHGPVHLRARPAGSAGLL